MELKLKQTESRGRLKFSGALLVAGALSACGGRTELQDYPMNEVQTPPVSDSGADAIACPVNPAPWPACGSASVHGTLAASGILNFGKIGIRFDGFESHAGTNNAIISILDSSCNVLKKDKIGDGSTKTFLLGGESFDVSSGKFNLAQEQAEITVAPSGCEAEASADTEVPNSGGENSRGEAD